MRLAKVPGVQAGALRHLVVTLLGDSCVDLVHVKGPDLGDEFIKACGGQCAGLGEHKDFFPKGHQCGDRHDAGGTGEFLVGFGVDFGEHDVGVVHSGFFEHGGEHLARAAPLSPPVDQHDVVVLDGLVEGFSSDVNGGHGDAPGSRGVSMAAGPPVVDSGLGQVSTMIPPEVFPGLMNATAEPRRGAAAGHGDGVCIGMGTFQPWVYMVYASRVRPALAEPVELHALMATHPVLIIAGMDLTSLTFYPPAHLALGPVTFGGLVVVRTEGSARLVCADHAGAVEVWEGGTNPIPVEVADTDRGAVDLLQRLMVPPNPAPSASELMARLLLWGWVARIRRVGRTDNDDAVKAFASGDLEGLAAHNGLDLPPERTAATVCSLAMSVEHPELGLPPSLVDASQDRQLGYLHALLPARWMLADELRRSHRRHDLAAMVMAAPAL